MCGCVIFYWEVFTLGVFCKLTKGREINDLASACFRSDLACRSRHFFPATFSRARGAISGSLYSREQRHAFG